MKGDFCVSCKNQMLEIKVGGILKRCFVCVEEKCPRFGLMAVVGYKLVKKMKEKEVKKYAKLSAKSSEKPTGKKS